MRIVHVSDFYLPRLGGIELQVAHLAAHQRAAGHQVGVLTATAAGPGDAPADVPVLRTGFGGRVRTSRVGRPRLDGPMPADVVHVHLGGVTPLGWAVLGERAGARLPTVVTVHSVLDRLQLLHRLLRDVGGWRDAPVVWCGVSQRVAAQLRDLLGPRAVVHVLPNAVDPSRWASGPAERPRPTDPGRPDPGRPVLVVAALRHTRRKRAEALPGILARALELLPAEAARHGTTVPELRAVIAGAGSRSAALRRGVAAAGLADRVELPGRLTQEELRALYHRADVFVAPTVLESFGLAALEARTAGLPVVARLDSGSGEVLEAGREALLVGSDGELAAALARLAVDDRLRTRIAAHNRSTPTAFDWPGTLALAEHAYATARLLTSRAPLPRPVPVGRPAGRQG